MLFELCQKQGKQVDIKFRKTGAKNVATVYVGGKFIASGSSEKKETAKLNAAKQALLKLSESMPTNFGRLDFSFGLNKSFEIDGAKQKLHELCGKKKWPKPIYRYELLYYEQWSNRKYACVGSELFDNEPVSFVSEPQLSLLYSLFTFFPPLSPIVYDLEFHKDGMECFEELDYWVHNDWNQEYWSLWHVKWT